MAVELDPQIGTSITADFDDNTWTFEMQKGFTVTSGKFIIMPADRLVLMMKYEYILSKVNDYTLEEIENKLP